jgi:hypothetical protein
MEPLDGNAIAGALHEAFDREMTTVTGVCRNCGAAGPLAELRVYTRAPGIVGRCGSCGTVVLVIVEIGGTPRLHMPALELREDRPMA